MTKRSLKGTLVTTLAGLTRDIRGSFWFNDTTPNSAKDNPIEGVLFKKLIDDVVGQLINGVLKLNAPTTDFVAFTDTTDLTAAGSVYTVNAVFYAYMNGELYKVNTGTDTEVDTMTLAVSATEDGMYRTLDLVDGASGSGVVDVANILWLHDIFNIDTANELINLDRLTDGKVAKFHVAGVEIGSIYVDDTNNEIIFRAESGYTIVLQDSGGTDAAKIDGSQGFRADSIENLGGTGPPNFPGGLTATGGTISSGDLQTDLIRDEAGTGPPNFSQGLKLAGGADILDYYEEGSFTPVLKFGGTGGTTYANNEGYYIRVGNMVSFTLWIDITSITGSGACTIEGLPFSIDNTVLAASPGNDFNFVGYITSATVADHANFNTDTTDKISVDEITDAGTISNLTDADFSGATNITVSGFYYTT